MHNVKSQLPAVASDGPFEGGDQQRIALDAHQVAIGCHAFRHMRGDDSQTASQIHDCGRPSKMPFGEPYLRAFIQAEEQLRLNFRRKGFETRIELKPEVRYA